MAILSIEGVAMPTPSSFDVQYLDISKAERNANGLMLIERITTKVKLQVQYEFLTAGQLKTILNAVSPVYYNVTYHDPKTDALRTSSFYCGDRSIGFISYINSVPKYKNVSFDLIER